MATEDESVLRALRQAAEQFDPMPPEVRDAALGAFAWRTIGMELAELSFDSTQTQPELALRSGSASPRLLTFESSTITVDLEATSSQGKTHLVGHIYPEQPALLEIRHRAGVESTSADEHGRFSLGGIQSGPVRLVLKCRPHEEEQAIRTDWIIL